MTHKNWEDMTDAERNEELDHTDDNEPPERTDSHLDPFVDREGRLDDADPDWREHFGDNVDAAYAFYFPGYPASAT